MASMFAKGRDMENMTGQLESSVLARLDKLEKQNRRLKRVGFVLLFLSGAFFWMGQARVNISKEIQSRKFTLVDVKGKRRA